MINLVLRRLRCKFHDEYNTTTGWGNIVDELDVHDKISRKGNFLFRYKSRRLCRPPFCPMDKSTEEYDCKFHCPDVDPTVSTLFFYILSWSLTSGVTYSCANRPNGYASETCAISCTFDYIAQFLAIRKLRNFNLNCAILLLMHEITQV